MASGSFDDKFKHYEPVDGTAYSSKDLNRSYWIVSHKILLRNSGVAFLIALDIGLVGYAVWGFGSYLFGGQSRDEAAVISVANRILATHAEAQKDEAAVPLNIGPVQVFTNSTELVDFAADVENPNKNWYVRVSYQFIPDGSASTSERTAYVLPGEHKYLTDLGEKFADGAAPSGASIQVVKQEWTRIDTHKIPSVEEYLLARHSFEITNPLFEEAGLAPSDKDVKGNRITFALTNSTAYNFWAIPVQVVLLRSGVVQGIEETVLREVTTGETRAVDLRNYTTGMVVDEVQVIPSVDVFDKSVYMNQ